MPSYRLVAKVEQQPGDSKGYLVSSPAVGVASGVPAEGVYLNPNEVFLSLTILNRRYTVQLPRNVQGMVAEQLIEDTSTPVAYGQPLLRLTEATALTARGEGASAGRAAAADADLIAVVAPSDGVFYRKPSPESPPYAEQGTAVTTGTVLGLVEVMKSFNQITYGGPGLPERGTVEKVLVEDAVEVAFGQTLFLVRPG